jgi:hypothetical protein
MFDTIAPGCQQCLQRTPNPGIVVHNGNDNFLRHGSLQICGATRPTPPRAAGDIRPDFSGVLLSSAKTLADRAKPRSAIETLQCENKLKAGDRRVAQFPNAGSVIARLAYARAKAAGIALDPLLKKIRAELPTKFDPVITSLLPKVLGLEIPPTFSANADEVIE